MPLAVEARLPAPPLGLPARRPLLQSRLLHGHGRDEPQVHELHPLALHPVAVAPLVGVVEAALQALQGTGLHRQLEGLPPVAQVGPAGEVWPFEVAGGGLLHLCEPALDLLQLRSREVREVRPHVVPAEVGDRQAERAQDAACAGDEDPLHAEFLGQGAGVHAAGAAEREEGELPGIKAALDADDAQRPDHLGVGDPHDTERHLRSVQTHLLPEPRESFLRQLAVQDHLAAQFRPVLQVAEVEVRVRDGRFRAALAVPRRTRFGAGGAGADA